MKFEERKGFKQAVMTEQVDLYEKESKDMQLSMYKLSLESWLDTLTDGELKCLFDNHMERHKLKGEFVKEG